MKYSRAWVRQVSDRRFAVWGGVFGSVFVIVTIGAVALALVQGLGRIVATQIDEIEPQINALLASRNVELEGARGRWHVLNPVLAADRVRIGASEFSKVQIELDLLESLLRNRVVARALLIESAYVAVEETPQGWRLRGLPPSDRPFDVSGLFTHSDALEVTAQVEITRNGQSATVYAKATGRNTMGLHRLRLSLSPEPDCSECALSLEFESHAPEWAPEWREDLRDSWAHLDASRFLVTQQLAQLWGLPGALLDVEGRWSVQGNEELAELGVSVTSLDLEKPLQLRARVSARNVELGYRGLIGDIGFTTAQGDSSLPPIDFQTRGLDGVDAWAGVLDLTNLATAVAGVFGADHVVGVWMNELEPNGLLRDVRATVDSDGAAFTARFEDLGLQSYKGVPTVRAGAGRIGGHNNGLMVDLDGTPVDLGFVEHFDASWQYERAAGPILFWFDRGYLGIRGTDLAIAFDGTLARGGFSLTRPDDRFEQRLTIIADVSAIDVPTAKQYTPRNLPGGLQPWLEASLLGGDISDARFMYHGHTRIRPGLPQRVVELDAAVANILVDYHRDWPLVTGGTGRVKVGRDQTQVNLAEATSYGLDLRDVDVVIDRTADYADVELTAQLAVERLFEFAWDTPVHEQVPVLTREWSGAGEVAVAADLHIPLRGQALQSDDLSLRFELSDATLDLADIGLRFEHLDGPISYRTPLTLEAESLDAQLFGLPTQISIRTIGEPNEPVDGVDAATAVAADTAVAAREGNVEFEIDGRATVADILEILAVDDLAIGDGEFGYNATYTLPVRGHPTLVVDTDLMGAQLHLPPPIGKQRADSTALSVELKFLDEYVAGSAELGGHSSGWIHVADEEILRGSVGIAGPVRTISEDDEYVTITGRLESAALSSALTSANASVDVALKGLQIGTVAIGDFEINDVLLDGMTNPSSTQLSITSVELDGEVEQHGQAPWELRIEALRIEDDSGADDQWADPLSVDVIADLVPADVDIKSLYFVNTDGEFEDFGQWQFAVRPTDQGVRVENLVGQVKGLSINATEVMTWDRREDSTRFIGSVAGADLAEVLPKWGYEVNLVSTNFTSQGDLTWPGSPLAFALESLSGKATTEVEEGRFVDVDQGGGAVRLVGLLNFSAIAERMRLDFSDVVAKGMSFKRVFAQTDFDDGVLQFAEPMIIEGNGSLIRVNGKVDLESGALDNEMIVTLPVSQSLPWYAAYLALANPAAGVGVLVANEIFGSQIENLSSGKYHIGGTLDEPIVEFDSIFTKEMAEADAEMEQTN